MYNLICKNNFVYSYFSIQYYTKIHASFIIIALILIQKYCKRKLRLPNKSYVVGMINQYWWYICFNNVIGKEYKELQIGQVSMPIGTIQVTVCYRTSMTLTSQQDPIMLKSDHFRKEYSPRHNQIKIPMYVCYFFRSSFQNKKEKHVFKHSNLN